MVKYGFLNNKGKNEKFIIRFGNMPFSSSAFAGSCPMLAGKLQSKIEAAKKLHDEGVKAHSNGDHAKSRRTFKKKL